MDKHTMNPLGYLRRTVRGWVLALAIVISLAAGYLVHGMLTGGPESHAPGDTVAGHAEPGSEQQPQWWTCSMHPQIKLPKPGLCPLCNMELIPLDMGDDDERGGLRELTVSEHARKLMAIETVAVERRFIEAAVRMVGKVDYDETRVKYITAWIPGRLDQVFVDFTGVRVRKGDHLVSLYSPELLSAQAELIQSIKVVQELANSDISIVREASEATIVAAREKLRLWGLTAEQVAEIERRGEPSDHMTIYAPIGGIVIHKNAQEGMYVKTGSRIYTIADLSEVWVELDAYESDLMWLRYGQKVEFTSEAYPGKRFVGTIAFIDPMLNQATRTVKVRVNVPNPDTVLKPGMFVRATVRAKIASGALVMDAAMAGKWICPMHPGVVTDAPSQCDICGMALVTAESLGYAAADSAEAEPPLIIPVTAALITGTRAVVYVEIPDRDKPTFEGREIVLGPRTGSYYIVQHGLSEGERVVTNGSFRIDAELQIRARPSMMTPEGGGGAGGHQHGQAPIGEQAKPGEMPVALPVVVRAQLHEVMAAGKVIADAVDTGDIQTVQAAFGRLGLKVQAIDVDRFQGHMKMLWKEYAMFLTNDAVEGRTVSDLTTAKNLAALTRQHLDSMSSRMGVTHGAHVAPAPQISDEFRRQLGVVIQDYLSIQQALAADEAGPARAAAGEALVALAKVDMSLVGGDDHVAWMKTSSELKTRLALVRSGDTIDAIRGKFARLSETMAAAAKRFGISTGPLYQFRCPMAFNNQGAIWLQTGSETRNPYFGGAMLQCGEVTEVIQPATGTGASDE